MVYASILVSNMEGLKMKIVFHGDRFSKCIKIGRFLKRYFPKIINIDLWDGYKSKILFKG